VSAVTAQNSGGVDAIFPVNRDSLEKQLRVLLSDIRPEALKLGMLYSAWTVEIIAKMMKEYSLSTLVIDPVTVSSSGASLVEGGTLDAIREKLFPLSKAVTPNIYEASVLTGIMIEDRKGWKKAKSLKEMGP
jgi:hydroxymethylpyrimidine/phosphomethylpyrimidine kinase